MNHFNPGKLADELHTLVGDAEELLRASAGSAGDKMSDARERAQETIRALRDRLASVERELEGQARVVDGYVQENPWKAIAVVGGLALLVGLLLGRK